MEILELISFVAATLAGAELRTGYLKTENQEITFSRSADYELHIFVIAKQAPEATLGCVENRLDQK